MDNFVVSARKYRPATFKSVVGQASITTTLKNSIKNNHLAHAYLFCGPRGVGKTTCARIFAKTINCLNITEDHEPCNECASCLSFIQSRSYNIHELDAASNNSVEDIRTLIEQVRIPPQLGKYSVYIIDEVHMLSPSAFNAFLKTLEEPPAHAVFILATTEKHKILPTILSRCQRFDFNRIKVEDAAKHLAYVAEQENITFEEDALNIIAQKADGAMRDALSLFDQIANFSANNISYQNAIDNLNVLDYDYYFRLIDFCWDGSIPDALLLFNTVLEKGFDGHHFVSGLSSHIRDIMVCTDEVTIELLEVGANIKERYKEQASKCSKVFLYRALNISNKCDIQYKTSSNQRLLTELMLMQLCNINAEIEEEKNKILTVKQAAVAKPPQKDATVQQQTETTAKQEIKHAKIKTSFSVKNAIVGMQTPKVETKETTTDFSEIGEDAFTEQQLATKWIKYAEDNTSGRIKAMLLRYKPTVKDGKIINFNIDTQSSKDTFQKEVHDKMIIYLRKELNNKNISIVTQLTPKQKIKKPLTAKDKYMHLLSKNNKLEDFKNKFDLTFNK